MNFRRWMVGLAMCGLVVSVTTAAAQTPHRPPRPHPAGERFQLPDRNDFQRSDERQDKRLTPEERRQLRRDIHDAGRDLYRDRPSRREFRRDNEQR